MDDTVATENLSWKVGLLPSMFSKSNYTVSAPSSHNQNEYYPERFEKEFGQTTVKPTQLESGITHSFHALPHEEKQLQQSSEPAFLFGNRVLAHQEDADNDDKKKQDTDSDAGVPHACPTCGKTFAWFSRLRTHMRVHTLEKPFECYRCGKAFAVKQYLNNHILRHESYESRFNVPLVPNSPDTMLHSSPLSSQSGASADGASGHGEASASVSSTCSSGSLGAGGMKKFKCAYCDKSYTRRCRLTEHLVKHLQVPALHDHTDSGTDMLAADQLPQTPAASSAAAMSTAATPAVEEEKHDQVKWQPNVQPIVIQPFHSPISPKRPKPVLQFEGEEAAIVAVARTAKKCSVSTFKVKALLASDKPNDAHGRGTKLADEREQQFQQVFDAGYFARSHFLSNSALFGKSILSTGFRKQKASNDTSAALMTAVDVPSVAPSTTAAAASVEQYHKVCAELNNAVTPAVLSTLTSVKVEKGEKNGCHSPPGVVQQALAGMKRAADKLLLHAHPRKKQSHDSASLASSATLNYGQKRMVGERQAIKAAARNVAREGGKVTGGAFSADAGKVAYPPSKQAPLLAPPPAAADSGAVARGKTGSVGGHSSSSSEEKKHVCELCFKSFKSPSNLSCHLNSHYGMKPYVCEVEFCSRGYCDKRSLRRHMESCHSVTSQQRPAADHACSQISLSPRPAAAWSINVKKLQPTPTHMIGYTTTSISAPMHNKTSTAWNLSKRDGFGLFSDSTGPDSCQTMHAYDVGGGSEEQMVALDLSSKSGGWEN